MLSERRLGPKLHGIFPGGRIEEYIPARPLLTKELADPTLSSMIAEKMAQIHMMQVPISKEPTWLWDTMAKWLDTATDILENIEDIDARHLKNVNAIRAIDLGHEIAWFRFLVKQQKYPVGFVTTICKRVTYCYDKTHGSRNWFLSTLNTVPIIIEDST